jgi:hypothetical protein
VVTDQKLDELAAVTDEFRSVLTPCLQHADFSPGHLFWRKGCPYPIDAEHASLGWPRFYDLAIMYTKLFVWIGPEPAEQFLRIFLDISRVHRDEMEGQFIGVMADRTVASYSDAYADQERRNYISRVHELYERCMERKLEAFLDG